MRETGHGLYQLQSKGEVSHGNERVARESADEDESGLKFSDSDESGAADADEVRRELDGYDAGRMTFEDAITDGLNKKKETEKDRRDATEEYLSRLTEGKEYEELVKRGVWQKI